MSKEYRIYDDRTDKTLFVGSQFECMSKLSLVNEDNEMFSHLWIEALESGDS